MLKSAILALALELSGGQLKGRAAMAVDAATIAASKVNATEFYPDLKNDPEAAQEKLVRLLVAWSYWESTWDHKAVGDAGRSCGIMQVGAITAGRTCKELTASPAAGYTAGLTHMRYLVNRCGSLRSALGAYASGKCGSVQSLVTRRCTKSGGC